MAAPTETTHIESQSIDYLTDRLLDSIMKGEDVGSVRTLLQKGVDINVALCSDGDTLLLVACLHGREQIVDLFIKSGANVDACCTYNDTTALHYATEYGWTEIVWLLVKKVHDLDARDFRGETALHQASTRGHLDIVKCLVEEGADINLKKNNGFTPLICAAEGSHKNVVDFFLNSMANVEGDEGKLIWFASHNGWLKIVQSFVKRVPDLNEVYVNGVGVCEPLNIAACNGYLEIMQCLVEGGSDINNRNVWLGGTVLHTASSVGQLEVVQWLLKKGPHVVTVFDINIKNRRDETALHLASEMGHLDIVKCLVEKGADVNIKNSENNTPLILAAKYEHENVVDFMCTLLEQGCDMDARNECGMTALHYACMYSLDAAQYLLKAGASWHIEDEEHDSPLGCVTREEKPKFIKLFIENGAFIKPGVYYDLVESSSEVLKDVKLCCQAILNKFNSHDLPELFKLPVSGSLPPMENIKIASDSELARGIEQTVGFEIQTKGHCNVLAVRPMALSVFSVRCLLEYHEKKKSEMQNLLKRSAAFDSDDEYSNPSKEIRLS